MTPVLTDHLCVFWLDWLVARAPVRREQNLVPADCEKCWYARISRCTPRVNCKSAGTVYGSWRPTDPKWSNYWIGRKQHDCWGVSCRFIVTQSLFRCVKESALVVKCRTCCVKTMSRLEITDLHVALKQYLIKICSLFYNCVPLSSVFCSAKDISIISEHSGRCVGGGRVSEQ